MKFGRPPKYNNPEEMQEKMQEYFNREVHYTITGLVLHLGFCDRKSFYEYEKKPDFTHTIKTARTMIENAYESHLHKQSNSGAIFALKNFGWSDKTDEVKEDKPLRVQIERISKD